MAHQTFLSIPDESMYETWRGAVTEYAGVGLDGSGAWAIEGFGPDRGSFEALLARYATEAGDPAHLPPGMVPARTYWMTDETQGMVGFLSFRHELNDFLARLGGHIGYSVRPSARRLGHASRALGLALDEARKIGLERVLITCDEDNTGSRRTIESQGGVYESSVEVKRRYWITL